MVMVHQLVGGLVILGFLLLAILNLMQVMGKPVSIIRQVSMAAGGLLILQYILGFLLMGQGLRNNNTHYLLALLAIVTVGLEHMLGRKPGKGMAAFLAVLATLVLVTGAYVEGLRGVGEAAASLMRW